MKCRFGGFLLHRGWFRPSLATPAQPAHWCITGDVVLSRKPTDWQGLLDVVALNQDDDLLIERRQTFTRRDPFEGSQE